MTRDLYTLHYRAQRAAHRVLRAASSTAASTSAATIASTSARNVSSVSSVSSIRVSTVMYCVTCRATVARDQSRNHRRIGHQVED